MKKTVKIVLAFSAMMTMTMAAFAQNSNSFNATAGTIRNDVNYSMDPRYFQEADFNDFLTYLNVNIDKKVTSHNGGYLDLGFEKKISDLTLGAYYYGDMWGNAYGHKYVKTPGTVVSEEVTVETTTDQCKNDFGILAGYKIFGLKLDFAIDANSSKTVVTTTPKNESATEEITKSSSTDFKFGGTFGASLDLSPFTLKPLASFGYNNNNKEGEKAFLMSLGSDFVFGKGSAEHIAGILYSLSAGSKETSSVTVSHPVNSINLYYKAHFDLGSKAEIGARVNVINKFDSYKETSKNNNETIENKFTYDLISTAAIGVKLNATQDFAFNTGIDVILPNVHSVSYPDSSIKSYETTSNCDFPTTIYAGCDLNIGKNWLLDASVDFKLGNVGSSIFSALTLGVSYRK